MARELFIDERRIADDSDCYVIAEIGNNHGGSLETCLEMIKAAKEAGADAVKLQKRHNKSLYTKAMYERPYDNDNSYGETYGKHREFLELDIEAYKAIQKKCQELEITFFATAFDFKSADELASIDMPAYKMASGDLRSIPLLKHVAKIGRPMIISTGGGSFEDVQRAYEAVYPINKEVAILQCTAGYPPIYEELDLKVIETYRESFPNSVIGLSSHDNGIAMALAAYMLGARIVEKHFTLNRAQKGTDHKFSLEPIGMRKMIRDLKRARIALGNGEKKVHASEEGPIKKMSKSIVAAKDLKAGQRIGEEDLTLKSPGGEGLEPYFFEELLGKTVKSDLSEDTYIRFEDLDQ